MTDKTTWNDLTLKVASLWDEHIPSLAEVVDFMEHHFKGDFYNCNTPEEKFNKYVEIVNRPAGTKNPKGLYFRYGLSASFIEQKTGWSRKEAENRLEQEVQASRLKLREILICYNDDCGNRNDDPEDVEEFKNNAWQFECSNCSAIGELCLEKAYVGMNAPYSN